MKKWQLLHEFNNHNNYTCKSNCVFKKKKCVLKTKQISNFEA